MLGTQRETGEEHVPDAVADKALNSMGHEEVMSNFRGLRERLDSRLMESKLQEFSTRNATEHVAKAFSTPDVILALRPQQKGATIVMDWPRSSFEGYYPAGTPTRSTSMVWNTVDPNRSQIAALSYIVEFLWRNHAEKGRVPGLRIGRRHSVS